MAGETTITIIGNLTADPELRYTPSGAPAATLTIASTPRTYDRNANEWRDGDTLFMRCTTWRDMAENATESLRKGMRVIASGRLTQRSYTTKDGEQRTTVELQVDEIGPALSRARAQVTRTTNNQQQTANTQAAYQAQAQGQAGWNNAPQGGSQGDPWSTQQGQPPF